MFPNTRIRFKIVSNKIGSFNPNRFVTNISSVYGDDESLRCICGADIVYTVIRGNI